MAQAETFTAAEAAFVLREPVRAVKKALDTGPVRPVLRRRAGMAVRTINWRDLVFLHAVRALRRELTPAARGEFYVALQRAPLARGREVSFGRFRVAIADLVDDLKRRTVELAQLADKVEFRSDGEPVLKGRDVEVYRIAALAAGDLSVEAIQEDYPSLSRASIETAIRYAAAHPKPGRPYPLTSAKRALRGAGLEALDETRGRLRARG